MSSTIGCYNISNRIYLVVQPDDQLNLLAKITNQDNFNKWPMQKIRDIIAELGISLNILNKDFFVFPDDTEELAKLETTVLENFIKKLFHFGPKLDISLDVDTNFELPDTFFPIINVEKVTPGTVKVLFGNTVFDLVPNEHFIEPISPIVNAIKNTSESYDAHIKNKIQQIESDARAKVMGILGSTNVIPSYFLDSYNGRIAIFPAEEDTMVFSFYYNDCKLKYVVDGYSDNTVRELINPLTHPPFYVKVKIDKKTDMPIKIVAYEIGSGKPYITFHSSDYVCMGNATLFAIGTQKDLQDLYYLIGNVFETANISGMFGSLAVPDQKALYKKIKKDGEVVFPSDLFKSIESASVITI